MNLLETCVIPELHVLQGFVNHLFWNGIVNILFGEWALLWPRKCNLASKNYHGEMFEEIGCNELCKKADRLNDPGICNDATLLSIPLFISAFKSMYKFVHISFSSKLKSLDAEMHEIVAEIGQCFLKYGTIKNLKIHVQQPI